MLKLSILFVRLIWSISIIYIRIWICIAIPVSHIHSITHSHIKIHTHHSRHHHHHIHWRHHTWEEHRIEIWHHRLFIRIRRAF
jgi:hypothetical protein